MRTVCSYLGKPYEEIHSVPTVGGKPVVVKTSSHETKKVFREVKPWWDGLTLREKILVPLSRLLLRIRRIFGGPGQPWLGNYEDLCQDLVKARARHLEDYWKGPDSSEAH